MITKEAVEERIKTIIDPDLYIDIWTLGLIYKIEIVDDRVAIEMTFTSMACPSGPQLVEQVRRRVGEIEGVSDVYVEVVFQPPWEPSEDLKALMGIG